MCRAACRCRDCKLYLSSNQSAITEDQGQGLWEQCVLGSVSQSDQWEVCLVTSRPSDWLKHIHCRHCCSGAGPGPAITFWLRNIGLAERWGDTSVSITTPDTASSASLTATSFLTDVTPSDLQLFSVSLRIVNSVETQREPVRVSQQWGERGHRGTWLCPSSRLLNGMFSQCSTLKVEVGSSLELADTTL